MHEACFQGTLPAGCHQIAGNAFWQRAHALVRGNTIKTNACLIILVCILVVACSTTRADHGALACLQEQQSPAEKVSKDDHKKAIEGLIDKAIAAGDGSVVSTVLGSGDSALAVYAAAPERPGGTVLFIHGYMAAVDSSGPAIRRLVDNGWLVVAFDLPGHGRSGGNPVDIGDFAEYGDALRLVADALADALAEAPGPLALVGHSLGAATILSALEGMTASPEALVLIAPLLRIHAHGLASFGVALAKPFTDTLPGGATLRWFQAYTMWARGDRAPALNAALAAGTRVGFILCGGDKAVSKIATRRLVKRTPGSTLTVLDTIGHWEIDKDEADPRLWKAVLAVLGGQKN